MPLSVSGLFPTAQHLLGETLFKLPWLASTPSSLRGSSDDRGRCRAPAFWAPPQPDTAADSWRSSRSCRVAAGPSGPLLGLRRTCRLTTAMLTLCLTQPPPSAAAHLLVAGRTSGKQRPADSLDLGPAPAVASMLHVVSNADAAPTPPRRPAFRRVPTWHPVSVKGAAIDRPALTGSRALHCRSHSG